MMKNLLFVYICLFGLALPLSAQKLDAQDILDRTATAFRQAGGSEWSNTDRKSTRLNSSHVALSRMPSSA